MITIKSEEEIKILREGGKKLAQILKKVASQVKPGISTGYLEKLACEMIAAAGGRPSFKGYQPNSDTDPYPTALCTSINDEIVHAPSLPSRVLRSGDIVGIDVGMEYPYMLRGAQSDTDFLKYGPRKKGLYTDMAVTVPVGKINARSKLLLNTTKKALELGIKQIKPGNTLKDIGRAVQKHAESHGFSIVRDLVGHGVGYRVHEDPQIPNFVANDNIFPDVVLRPGMVLAIEPMVNVGGWEIMTGEDGLTLKTIDGSMSAQFEHTIAVTKKGHMILTEL